MDREHAENYAHTIWKSTNKNEILDGGKNEKAFLAYCYR